MLLLAQRPERSWIVQLICCDPDTASGACHRSLQLRDLLMQGGYHLSPIELPPRPGSLALAVEGMAAGLCDGFYRPWGINSLRNAGAQASFCRSLFELYPQACGLVMEGTGYGSLTATAWCRRNGKRTILVPANLEALAPNPPDWPYALPLPKRWSHELPWLRQADSIFTIAIEEAWLLELNGIPCHHLPYYPPRHHRQKLKGLAEARRKFRSAPDADPIGYFFLADFCNPPNRVAFDRLLFLLRDSSLLPHPVHVAGRGCEKLVEGVEPALRQLIVNHGEVSDQKLFDLQRRCMALLILHPATSGMLTRIIDAALADLPVVGEWMSFKSYHHCFSNGLLMPISQTQRPEVVYPPEVPLQAESRFLELLSR